MKLLLLTCKFFYVLYVSLDFVKSLYAKFIDWDEDMYDLENDTPAHAAK